MTTPLIELRGISKRFGDSVILNGVDLQIYPGDSLTILGPSGTGKSSLLRIMAGLLNPDAGEIYLNGVLSQTAIDDPNRPLRMSMVFQQAALFDSLNVAENVGFYLYQHSKLPRGRIRELVEEKLELVGLPGIAKLYPSELSGGMRKRVSFARAILDDPEDAADDPQILLLFRCECCGHELHADLVGARNVAMRTLLVRQDWASTGSLSVSPDVSSGETKAEVLQRFSELRWSLDTSPHHSGTPLDGG